MKPILVMNGANLNMLGKREPGIYGAASLADLETLLRKHAKKMDLELEFFQSNVEGELINRLHEAAGNVHAVVLNPGGYTHTSVSLRDAISSIAPTPVIEVHLSNVYARPDDFRHKSLTAPVCIGQISGFGPNSYILALEAASRL
jgi:3-dehydroquinate dehydratase-2